MIVRTPVTLLATLALAVQAGPVLIREVSIVDVERGVVVQGQDVLLRDGRIASVSAASSSRQAEGARVVDGKGKFLIPGLWDMHAHISYYPGLAPDEGQAMLFPLYVANGVLGIRDMAGLELAANVRLAQRIQKGELLAPRLMVTGRALDGPPATDPSKNEIATPEQARAAVRELKQGGAQYVKVYDRLAPDAYRAALDEAGSQGLPVVGHLPFSTSALDAVKGGHRSIEHMGPGKLAEAVFGYTSGADPPPDDDPERTELVRQLLNRAIAGQIDERVWTESMLAFLRSAPARGVLASIARQYGPIAKLRLLRERETEKWLEMAYEASHERGARAYLIGITPEGKMEWLPDEPDVYQPEKAKALFAEMKRQGTHVTPTLTALRNIALRADPEERAKLRLEYLTAEARRLTEAANDPRYAAWTEVDWAAMRRSYERDRKLVGELHRAGVPLLAGADSLMDACVPGFALHDELELLVSAGLTPAEALRTATINPARFLGLEKESGSVMEGKRADLALLDADPLADITNTRRIAAVIRAGRLIERKELDAMLEGARRDAAGS